MVQLVGLVQVVKLRGLLTEIGHFTVSALVFPGTVCDLKLPEVVSHLVQAVLVAKSCESFVNIAAFEYWGRCYCGHSVEL